jgi:hypothetical protein
MTGATATSERYSDKRLKDSFTAYVLLSDTLQFMPSEIWDAVREDYPKLSWNLDVTVAPPFDTGRFSMATYLGGGAADARHGFINFLATPGPLDVDFDDLIFKSRFTFPEAKHAVTAHRSALSISVSSTDGSIESRFEAARRMTCIAAVFAKLPICVGIYFPSADLILPPTSWIEAANIAMDGKVPTFQWINFSVVNYEYNIITAHTIGCAAFNGFEVSMPAVRLNPTEALKYVFSAVTMMLEYGHEFQDSHTLGEEGSDEKLRIRFWPEGLHDAQTDTWALIHPAYCRDEIADFGPRKGTPPPPGYDNTFKGDESWLRKKIRLLTSPIAGRPN